MHIHSLIAHARLPPKPDRIYRSQTLYYDHIRHGDYIALKQIVTIVTLFDTDLLCNAHSTITRLRPVSTLESRAGIITKSIDLIAIQTHIDKSTKTHLPTARRFATALFARSFVLGRSLKVIWKL